MAINWAKYFFIGLIVSAAFLVSPILTEAAGYQQCAQNSSCTIGEFIYDDNYVPIAIGTSCSLTSRYPNGNVLINGENMAGTADGWYSYTVGTSGLSNGIYRGQMCCDTSGENMCLDKTFEISATLSSLVSDIWASPNRSLTSFGSLISDIWSHPSAVGNSTSLNSIGSSLANLSVQVSQIDTKIVTIDSKVDALATSISTIQTNTTNILNKWSTYSVSDIVNYIDTLETQLGTNSQTCADSTVFGQIQCIQDKWGTDSAAAILSAANNAYNTSTLMRAELNFAGKSTTAYDEFITLKSYVDSIESSIGSSSDSALTATIFGRVKQVNEAVAAIDNSATDLNDLLAKWGSYTATDIYDKVKNLSDEIASIDTVTNVDNLTTYTTNNITQTASLTELQNQVLSMRAILEVNRILLEKIDNKPIIKSWLENGSIVFKSLIINPSTVVSQEVPFIYFFPTEVKQTDILKKSPNIEIKYDTTKATLYAEGNFKLKPKESITIEIEVTDIWSVSPSKIDSLRSQANDLFAPLKKTSFFAQGATLHSDILASLDRIIEIQKPNKLPEDKIKDYRVAQIELESVNKKMDGLKEIVTQSGSMGNLSGFIGGVQTVGVWGIIVVLVIGFVLLAIYIKSINPNQRSKRTLQSDDDRPKVRSQAHNHNPLAIALVAGIALGASSSLSYFYTTKNNSIAAAKPTVLSATTEVAATPTPEALTPTPTTIDVTAEIPESTAETIEADSLIVPTIVPTTLPTVAPTLTPTHSPTAMPTKTVAIPPVVGTKAIIVPSLNSYVNVRVDSNREAKVISRVLSGSEVYVTAEKENSFGEKWLKISQENISGWVLGQLVQYVENTAAAAPSAKVSINVPSHDTVYVYAKPSFNAAIVQKITSTQPAEILLETKMWAKVILTRNNTTGWISQDFINKGN